MTRSEAMKLVTAELGRAAEKFPLWPTDPHHALDVLGEEFGELAKAIVEHTYEPGKSSCDEVQKEAVQTAAMAIRFLMGLHRYHYRKSDQYLQFEGGSSK
jgi:hypothetical protein